MRLLVILDRPETAIFTLETAGELADRLKSTEIRVLHPEPATDPDYQSPDEGMPDASERARFAEEVSSRAANLRQTWHDWIRTAGREGAVSWNEAAGDIRDIVAREARDAGLVVLSRPRRGDPDRVAQAFAGALYDAAATVVVAPLQHHATVGRFPVIAWHDSTHLEAAVRSAWPLLVSAEKVTVIIGEAHPDDVSTPSLVEELRGQGVMTSVDRFVIADGNLGEQIRSHALSAQADLLVMGAYSRPHFIEWLFGGPTQDILTHTTLPILTHH